ncbi:MAG: NAD kinase [Alphaproteobacteria bacterium]|nr:MAG: NAD kinase [Alphaproteobacteria bacterium]
MPQPGLHFAADVGEAARRALDRLVARYGQVPVEQADVIVALGGDGFMLATLHATQHLPAPVYGMNRGTVGFLMNEYREDGLIERIAAAQPTETRPLRMRATTASGVVREALAINEVSLFREGPQAAHLRVLVDGRERMNPLICDGAMVCTPAGSTAYNYSAHGPIIPIGAEILALTPVSAFRPRRWRGALLPTSAVVCFETIDAAKRPVAAVADNVEVRDVVRVEIAQAREVKHTLLFDPGHGLEERLIREQFS